MEDFKEDIWKTEDLKGIYSRLKDYVDTRIRLLKLSATEAASRIIAAIALGVILSFIGIFALVMLSISLGFALGYLFNSHALGFLAVGGVYILLGLILYMTRRAILLNPIINAIITLIFPEENEKDQKS